MSNKVYWYDDRDWVHNHVPVDMHHSGYDEGYYYDDCPYCGRRTEHDDGDCIPCSNGNDRD